MFFLLSTSCLVIHLVCQVLYNMLPFCDCSFVFSWTWEHTAPSSHNRRMHQLAGRVDDKDRRLIKYSFIHVISIFYFMPRHISCVPVLYNALPRCDWPFVSSSTWDLQSSRWNVFSIFSTSLPMRLMNTSCWKGTRILALEVALCKNNLNGDIMRWRYRARRKW